MVGSFACPECFSEIVPKGVSPGRRVRCLGCGTMVEVPFLVRVGVKPSSRKRSRAWAWLGVGVAAALLVIALFTRLAKTQVGQAHEREVAAHVDSARQAEKSGRCGLALVEVEAALALIHDRDEPALPTLREWRDRLSVRDAEARLAEADASRSQAGDDDRLLPSLRALKDRSRKEEILAPLADRIDEALSGVCIRRSELALAGAEAERLAGRPEAAIRLCLRAVADVDGLRPESSSPIREKARGEVARVVGRFGVVIEPVRGEFLQGPSSGLAHTASLQPAVSEALRRHHFVPRPEGSPFASVWDEQAPFRLAIRITERNDGVYFQTPLRTSALAAELSLMQSGNLLWQSRASGKTRVPPPRMSAFEASHLAMVKAREPALEKRLYDDARQVLAENIAAAMRNLPSP